MKWQDEAIILGSRPYGETSVILEVLTKNHGYHAGLVKGGASKVKRSILQPGNLVQINWRARLEEQLGNFSLEVVVYYAVKLMNDADLLYAFSILRFHINLLTERVKHELLYDILLILLEYGFKADEASARFFLAELVLRFEFVYLAELGFGIDTNSCAATGTTVNLCYVSPKSGQAVSRAAGEPWKHKLLLLPQFLLYREQRLDKIEDIEAGQKLLTYFLYKNIWQPDNIKPLATRSWFFENIIENIQNL
ncbi:MAG: DNA repair protein RecO [Alphaproteobacteria bacterium]|nr:DNA repair protein RecO [Alphaproteobacteria bacterium]